jgi:hypothetical protein
MGIALSVLLTGKPHINGWYHMSCRSVGELPSPRARDSTAGAFADRQRARLALILAVDVVGYNLRMA